jgi:dihydroorotate dehydrogenase electron transfer subunit
VLHGVALAAETHGAWSQTAVAVPDGCGTGLCLTCVLPVVGEDGGTRMVRACAEGPVFRGDRVRWGDVGSIPADARGAS